MSSTTTSNSNSFENSSENNESIFNSKLFFDIQILDFEENSSSNTESKVTENTNTNEFDEIFNNLYLSKGLIEELNLEKEEKKETNSSNPLLPLVYNGYSFFPKSFKIKAKETKEEKKENEEKKEKFKEDLTYNIILNKFNLPIYPIYKQKNLIKRKGDWTCSACKNLNFSFRNRCNKCGLQKPKSNE